jgi:hypothetical protein
MFNPIGHRSDERRKFVWPGAAEAALRRFEREVKARKGLMFDRLLTLSAVC